MNIVLFIYILVAFFLILFILLDRGKGSEVGALSSGNDFLSAKSSSTFFNKLIVVLVLMLLIINFSITFLSKSKLTERKPIVDISYDKK